VGEDALVSAYARKQPAFQNPARRLPSQMPIPSTKKERHSRQPCGGGDSPKHSLRAKARSSADRREAKPVGPAAVGRAASSVARLAGTGAVGGG
jgi:hypothetical protein